MIYWRCSKLGRHRERGLFKKAIAIALASMMLFAMVSVVSAETTGVVPTGISYEEVTVFKADKGDDISIELDGADIRDVLSMFAKKLGVNIVYLGTGFETSFSISGVDATTAFEIFMKSTGINGQALSYVRDGDLLLVGAQSALSTNFSDMMVFTRFKLNYMTATDLQDYLSQLGVDVTGVIVNDSTDTIFVKGMPYEVSQVSEIVNLLDREEYYPDGSQELNLVAYKLKYISATILEGVLGELGIQGDTIIMNASPQTLWVSADHSQHQAISTVIGRLDTPDNISDNEFGVYRLKYIDIDLVNDAMNDLGLWTTAQGAGGTVTVIPNTVLSEDPYAILVNFKFIDKEMVDFLITELDTPSNLPEDPSFFIYTFENISAALGLDRIESFSSKKTFDLDEVEFKEFAFSGIGSQIMVLCTKSEEQAVRLFLDEIDTPGATMIAVVDSASGDMMARVRLLDRIPLISYISGVSQDNMYVSGDISKTGTPQYVMWVEDTPENIERVKAAIANIDSGE
jgi:hypothetical protein